MPALGREPFTVAALDLGIKAMTPRSWPQRGVEMHVLPATAHRGGAAGRRPGRGVPVATARRPGHRRLRGRRWSARCCGAACRCFGICFGNQILGRALGFGTYKLRYGHRGINQPVLDRATGKVEVTAHNHGFAVDAPLDEADRHRVRPGRGQPRRASTTTSSRGCAASTCRRSACSTTRRPRPARTTPHYLFDRFVRADGGRLDA